MHRGPRLLFVILLCTSSFVSSMRLPVLAYGISSEADGRARDGRDAFGYVADDAVTVHWINAAAEPASDLCGDDAYEGPVGMGFDFPFYENVYRECFVSTNGLITFGEGSTNYFNRPIPVPAPPMNMIAVLWDDLCVSDENWNQGLVYYLRGGVAPDRYFVVEWHAISFRDSRRELTFEAILREGGDIDLQYLVVAEAAEKVAASTVGIENGAGDDGLRYDATRVTGNWAVRFHRPAASARIRASPAQQGRFSRAGETVVFDQSIYNTGDLGADTYEVAISSAWSAAAVASDGRVLMDSDDDGDVDTGPVPQGGRAVVQVWVSTPTSSGPGAANAAVVTLRSSRDPAQQATLVLRTCVPAPFVQEYGDGVDNATALYLVHPTGRLTVKVSTDQRGWESPVVAELSTGNLFYGWSRERFLSNGSYVHEIEYAVLGPTGDPIQTVRRLVDHSEATRDVHDQELAVAATGDGRIGLTWVRMLVDDSGREQYNVYFAIFGQTGNLVAGPTDVTRNQLWYGYGDLDKPCFADPAVGSIGTGFGVAWTREHMAASTDGCADVCAVTDICYAIYRSNGTVAVGSRRLTSDTPGDDDSNSRPNLASLAGDALLISWTRGGSYGDIYDAVLNGAGQVTKAAANLSGDGSGVIDSESDAMELGNGRVVVAWTADSDIRLAVLGQDRERIAGPITLLNSAALLGNAGVSVASAGDWAVLTWQDAYAGYAPNLYYALVDGSGAVLTPPMIFRTSAAVRPRLQASRSGHGNTSYHVAQFPTPTSSPVSPTPNASWTASSTPTLSATLTATPSPTPSGTAAVTRTPRSFLGFLPVLVRMRGVHP